MQNLLFQRPLSSLLGCRAASRGGVDANRRAATPAQLERLEEQSPAKAGIGAVVRAWQEDHIFVSAPVTTARLLELPGEYLHVMTQG